MKITLVKKLVLSLGAILAITLFLSLTTISKMSHLGKLEDDLFSRTKDIIKLGHASGAAAQLKSLVFRFKLN